MKRALSIAALIALANSGACVGTTGSALVTFRAYASGPPDATRPYDFDTGRGFHVTLRKAFLHVGAIYLKRNQPISGAEATGCILQETADGNYVAEVTTGLDIDVLSPAPQELPLPGNGTADLAANGEVWLTGGNIDAAADPTLILDLEGTATKGDQSWPFSAAFTIGENRALPPTDSEQPGANPICKQRIAGPIPANVTPENDGGALFLQIDPHLWFANVDFSQLSISTIDPSHYAFVDSSASSTDSASRNLFLALHDSVGVYSFSWHAP